MTLYYRHHGHVLIIFGNTYPVRDQIKAMGGTFSGPERHWRVPFTESALGRLDDLCRRYGGGPLEGSTGLGISPPQAGFPASSMPHVGPEANALSLGEERGRSAQETSIRTPSLPSRIAMTSGLSSLPDSVVVANEQGITVSELMNRAQGILQAGFPDAVWVTAEVQNLAPRASGIFFDLAEGRNDAHANATVTVKAILWRGIAEVLGARLGPQVLKEVLQDGLKVRVLCRVQLYKDRGHLTLVIEDIDPAYTKGALALAREKLLKELRAKGLDGAQKRLRMRPFPFKVGLISAKGSRAETDFLDQLFSLRFPGSVLFCPTPMQGEAVPKRVVAALKALEEAGCDVIVITRGGGSAADLRWFDAPEVAYGIVGTKVPVVAAIGHHDDVAVAEEICFVRQKTPTAAADFVAQIFETSRLKIETLAADLSRDLGRLVEEFALLTATLSERLGAGALKAIQQRELDLARKGHLVERTALTGVQQLDQRLLSLSATMAMASREWLSRLGDRLSELERQLIRYDPAPWLAQGWTQLMGPKGIVRHVADVALDEDLKVRLVDGRLTLKVTDIKSVHS